MRQSLFKKIFLLVVVFTLMVSPVSAQEMLTLNQRTSHYMNMNKRITRIAVGSPEIATVIQLPGSATEFLIVTKNQQGSTALFVWTADGSRHEYTIIVSQEDPGQARLLEKAIGLPDVHVKMVGQRVLLTGTVEDQFEKNYVLQTVRLFVGKASNSSLLVGSGFDMKLETSKATEEGRSEDLEASKSENTGEIIDLLQIRNPTQIRLEAQIIEINSEDAKALGIKYGNLDGGELNANVFAFGESYNRAENPIHFKNNPIRWLGQHFSLIDAEITALVTKGKARILSHPNVMTLSGEAATIQIGGEIPYVTTSVNGRTNTDFKRYGIILQFKPVVDEQKRIISMIHAEVSNLSGQYVNGQPIISTRSADSMINVHSGGTIVIGGLMDSTESKNVEKIPLLGDIPILGEFFKHTTKTRDKRELIILVTPHIVGADESGQTNWSPIMQQWYELDKKYYDTTTKVDFNKPKDEIDKVDETDTDKETERKYFSKTAKETTKPFYEK